MTDSRSRTILAALAVLTLGMMVNAPARAQWTSDKPPVLKPSDYPPEETEDPPDSKAAQPPKHSKAKKPSPEGESQPRALGPTRDVVQSGELPPPGGAPTSPAVSLAHRAPVQVDSLGTAEGLPIGTLDPANGGFSDQFWGGSERGKVETLLAKAPLAGPDPVLRDLVRRVVLTKALPPPGPAKQAFASLRIERLLDAGLISEAGALAAAADIPKDEDFAKIQARAVLYANRKADVCGKATATRLSAGDVFWLQLRTYCATLAGDSATADLTREVLKAQGQSDPAFDALLNEIGAKKPEAPATIKQPSAIHLYLLQQAGLPITEALARKLGTPAAVLAVRDHRNPPKARLDAAERVALTGAISPSDLRVLAEDQDLPLSRVANAAEEAPKLPYYQGQVLLRRAIEIENKPESKARLIALALSLGEKYQALALTAVLQGDVIAAAKPNLATTTYARQIAQALVLSRRFDAASAWAAHDPILRVIIALGSQDATRIAAAQPDLVGFGSSDAATDPDRSYKALILGVAEALGVVLPAPAQAAAQSLRGVQWPGKRPPADLMARLAEAAPVPERRGEAILLLTTAVQGTGLSQMAPDATVELVRRLTVLNETRAARALALEALAQYRP